MIVIRSCCVQHGTTSGPGTCGSGGWLNNSNMTIHSCSPFCPNNPHHPRANSKQPPKEGTGQGREGGTLLCNPTLVPGEPSLLCAYCEQHCAIHATSDRLTCTRSEYTLKNNGTCSSTHATHLLLHHPVSRKTQSLKCICHYAYLFPDALPNASQALHHARLLCFSFVTATCT